MPTHPTAFISYSRDDEAHKEWVRQLATKLRADGVEARLDEWHSAPGDQFPHFMEREIRSDDFVIIICTPQYKTKFDERTSGAGYEAEIITAEISAKQNHRKFITVLARGTWAESVPYALRGKKYIDLSDVYRSQRNYPQLRSTILGTHPQPPPMGRPKPPVPSRPTNQMRSKPAPVSLELYDRRLPVYKAAQRLVDYIITKGACTEQEGKFGAVIRDARHLFNEDTENYLRALYREATAVWLGKEKQERMAGQHDNEEYRRSLNALCDRLIWFSTQLAEIKRRFDPFLQIQR